MHSVPEWVPHVKEGSAESSNGGSEGGDESVWLDTGERGG